MLSFENLTGDPEQEYFADGITDDLTTDLSHFYDSFFIISRGTAYALGYYERELQLDPNLVWALHGAGSS